VLEYFWLFQPIVKRFDIRSIPLYKYIILIKVPNNAVPIHAERVLEANFLELKWTEMVIVFAAHKKKSMVRQSAPRYIYREKNKRRLSIYTTTLNCCRHKKTRGLDESFTYSEGRPKEKKGGSSHGPSSLLVHYICYTQTRMYIGQSISNAAGWSFYILSKRRREHPTLYT
jgi:hypothetical protein